MLERVSGREPKDPLPEWPKLFLLCMEFEGEDSHAPNSLLFGDGWLLKKEDRGDVGFCTLVLDCVGVIDCLNASGEYSMLSECEGRRFSTM